MNAFRFRGALAIGLLSVASSAIPLRAGHGGFGTPIRRSDDHGARRISERRSWNMAAREGGQSGAATSPSDQPGQVVMADGSIVITTVGEGVVTRTAVRSGAPPVDTALPLVTPSPNLAIGIGGAAARTIGVDRNSVAGTGGNSLTVIGGGAATGGTDLPGGDIVLQGGLGTGLGGGGNVRLLTARANAASGTTDNTYADRIIVVAKAKALTLPPPGFTALMSILLSGTETGGGRIFYTIRATDGGTQIATEEGVIQYLATANSITCTVQTTDKLHLGTVNSGCSPGFFNPGSHPGISVFDNVSFSTPAAIVVHEVYFTIENQSGAAIRLEP